MNGIGGVLRGLGEINSFILTPDADPYLAQPHIPSLGFVHNTYRA